MPESSKRKHEEDLYRKEFIASFFCNLIRQATGQDRIGEFILDMARNENLTLEDLETLTEKHPASLPKSEWEKVAPSFGLNPSFDQYQLRPFTIPHAYLPQASNEGFNTVA
jgi:hypothetical protein